VIRLELLNNCDEQTWDEMVTHFETGTIFHTFAWMKVVEKLRGAEKLPFGIFDGSNLVGVFPLFRLRRGPLTILASPLGGVGYGGPLLSKTYCRRAVLEQIDNLAKDLRADYIEFRSLELLDPTLLTDRQDIVQEPQTYVLSLNKPTQELWASLKSECRTAIRKARKCNVEIVEATDKSFLDVYYEMVKDTYRKSNRLPPFSKQDYATVWDILKPRERIKVLLAKHQEQVIAGAIFLHFHDKVYYWDGVAFQTYYSLRPNNLIHWTLIEWGVRNALTQYDMLGANIPRIASFKKSFGSELQAYTYAYKDTTWQAYLGRRLYLWLAPQFQRVQLKLRSLTTQSLLFLSWISLEVFGMTFDNLSQ